MLKSRYLNCWTTVIIFEHLLTQIVSELAKEDETLFIQKNVKCPGGNALFVSPAKIIIFLVLGPEK